MGDAKFRLTMFGNQASLALLLALLPLLLPLLIFLLLLPLVALLSVRHSNPSYKHAHHVLAPTPSQPLPILPRKALPPLARPLQEGTGHAFGGTIEHQTQRGHKHQYLLTYVF